MSDAFKKSATAPDGKQYFVPISYYPWAVFYRKSVFEKNGWAVPTSMDEMTALMKDMQGKKITPIAFAAKDAWAPMGTFDILNMRLNGYDFHMGLCQGKEKWDSAEVKNVFTTWKDTLLPYQQENALGRTWQEAATSMANGETGMYLLGTFVVDGIPKEAQPDLDFFTFPALDQTIGSDALDAPIDGFCVAAAAEDQESAKAYISWLGTAEAADAGNNAATAPFIAANSGASTETYGDLQKKSVELVEKAKSIAQFLDRDTNADLANTVITASLQDFLKNPDDIDAHHRVASSSRPRPSSADPDEEGIMAEARIDARPVARSMGDGGSGSADTRPAGHLGRWSLIPTVLVVWLVWLPALASLYLSFTKWNGFRSQRHRVDRHEELHGHRDDLPAVLAGDPAQPHLVGRSSSCCPRILGILLAVILDREMWGSRFYQTAFYLPVVLSLALVGFIWQLFYSTDQGLINQVFGTNVDWYGDPDVNLWAVLVATAWRHTGYIMLIYLAGLKGVDSTLREAAAVDGAGEVKTFFQVIFPVMRPINMIVLVIVVIESLRAFDLVWVINKGRNGLELISALVSQNVIGEATRYGFGSALAVIMMVISSVFIVIYLRIVFREERR